MVAPWKDGITAERLRELVDYDEATGHFTWRLRRSPRTQPGKRAGSLFGDGYRYVGIDGITYKEHRLAWLYVRGGWPRGCIDHVNRVRHDNRICNLREASYTQNNVNKFSRNGSGLRGAYRHANGRWISWATCRGVKHYLGLFDTPEAAHAAYVSKTSELHGDFALEEAASW